MPVTRSMGKSTAEDQEGIIRHEESPQSPSDAVEEAPKKTRSRASTTRSVKALRLAQAREEVANRKLLLAEAKLAAIEAEPSDDEDADSVTSHHSSHTKVMTWLEKSKLEEQKEQEQKKEQPAVAEPKSKGTTIDLTELASAIAAAARTGDRSTSSRYIVELPYFNGAHQEWLPFKAAYCETEKQFSDIENTARLRKCLKGKAKEAVSGLMIANARPTDIMKALETRFGRADAIALAELERLRQISKPTDAPRDICIFANKVKNSIATLRVLNKVHYLHNPEVVKTIIEKLTPTLRYRWFDFAAEKYTEPDLLKFDQFIEREADICGRFAPPENIFEDNTTVNIKRSRPAQQQRSYSTIEKRCALCESSEHSPASCYKFKKADVNSRWDIAKENRLCFRCLQYRNKEHSCPTRVCGIEDCTKTHSRMLHYTKKAETRPNIAERPKRHEPRPSTSESRPNFAESRPTTAERPNAAEDRDNDHEAVSLALAPAKTRSYLKIIKVRVIGPAGEQEACALLDDGSTVSLIDARVAAKVGAQGPRDPLRLEAISDTKINEEDSQRVNVKIIGPSGKSVAINARTINNLNIAPCRATIEEIKSCRHLQSIESQLVYESAKPKILIGQDNWPLLIATKIKRGRKDQPVASLTELGWVLHGAHTRTLGQQVNFVHRLSEEDRVDEIVKRYFDIDSLGIEPRTTRSDPEVRATELLEQHTSARPSGGYETALLWKTDELTVPNNYDGALKRLKSIENKIEKDPVLRGKYSEQIENLVKKGYAELAPSHSTSRRTWYLPHFAVLHPAKPGKVRVVFDAAARYGGVSLNDNLLSGPDLLQSLPGVLMRFRQHAIAVAADIEEMFLRIGIRSEDRDMLRFLWRKNKEEKPTEYRMKSVIFGAASSPCTALFVKNHNALKYQNQYPEAVDAIINHHYMDDYLQSFTSIEEAKKIATTVKRIHKEANFNLCKWRSNSGELERALDGSATTEPSAPVDITKNEEICNIEKILGLTWRPSTDTMGFNLNFARVAPEIVDGSRIPTKREALKTVMSIFDPLGLASPVTIQAKHLLQETWRTGTGWDEPLPTELGPKWATWVEDLKTLGEVNLPRCHPALSEAVRRELHTFVDASERTYAAAVYWRVIDKDGNIFVSLAAAKARVAPIKLTSIPRLELQAAVLGCRLANTVKKEYEVQADGCYYWTDSKTVLSWLQAGPRTFKAFVAHRVAEIEDSTTVNEWRWLPTRDNVADDATRDTPRDFSHAHRWFTGPSFLYADVASWPQQKKQITEPTGEERTMVITEKEKLEDVLPAVSRFSSWTRLIRTTARVLQAIEIFKNNREAVHYKRTAKNKEKDPKWSATKKKTEKIIITAGPSTVKNPYRRLDGHYLLRAEELWVRASQQTAFHEEIETITANRSLPTDSRLKQLSVFIDNRKILKIKSRIAAASDITEGQRWPAVLDGDHMYTRLYIRWTHEKLQHAGTELIVNELRQHYYIVRLRPSVKTVIKSCFACRMKKAVPPSPPTGDHPKSRLAHHHRPFSFVGLDYFGPLSITVGRHREKRYVALFTCLTTRAIHLEIVNSLSADSAVLALRRMFARRGMPTEIYSDNGTNMHGALTELQDAAHTEADKRAIVWRFLPPSAPFMGGAWERMVRAVKSALYAVLEGRHPQEDVLTTLLCEAEYTVNSRPLTHVSVNADDEEALTPNHFIMGGSGRVTAPGTFDERDLLLRKKWRHAQALADQFWGRWLREYLPELQYRREPHGRGAALQVDDLVLIADSNLPRNVWPRGRVVKVFPGPDGIVRTADIKTQGGLLRRPVKKLVVLPIDRGAVVPTPSEDAGHPSDAARRENVPDARQE